MGVDSLSAASSTGKQHQMWDDITVGAEVIRATIADPGTSHSSALRTALIAGAVATRADIDADAGLPLIHTLSCVATVAWPELPFSAVATSLLPHALRMWDA